jgi:hypothetical protein
MDLTPLMHDSELDVTEYTLGYVDRLRDEISTRIRRYD